MHFGSLKNSPYNDEPRLGCKANDAPFDQIVEKDPLYRDYFYDSPNHELWTALTVGAKFLGVDPSTIEKRLPENTEILPGRNASNRRIDMIRLSVMQHTVSDIFTYPQVITKGEYRGFFEDEEGKLWTTILDSSENLNIDFGVIKKNLPNNTPTIQARNLVNVLVTLYPWTAIQHAVSDIVALEDVKDDTYLERDGLHFGSFKKIARTLGCSDTVIKNRRNNLRTAEAKIKGIPHTLYCIEGLLKDPTVIGRLSNTTLEKLKKLGITSSEI